MSIRLLLVFLYFPIAVFGQQYKAVEVFSPQRYKLSSYLAPNVSGSNSTRRVIPVNLPHNTVKWFYSVSTGRNPQEIENVQRNFNLFGSISRLVDNTGISANIISRIGSPPVSNSIDVYLLYSKQDRDIFLSKYSNLGGGFRYVIDDSKEQIVSGNVEVISRDRMYGVQYLGIRNTDASNSIEVCIQVVAIIQEPEQQSSYSSYNNSNNDDENSAGQDYRHANLFSTIENTDNSTNTNVAYHSERIDYTILPNPQNGWGSKEISELTGKYGDLLVLILQRNNESVPPNYLIEFTNCMAAYTVGEYRYSDYQRLEYEDRMKMVGRSVRHCKSAMNN